MQSRIPRYLHQPPQLLWFQPDDIGLAVIFYFMWLLIDHSIILLAMPVAVYTYMNTKEKMPRGYLKHVAYSLGFWASKYYPSPAVKVHHE